MRWGGGGVSRVGPLRAPYSAIPSRGQLELRYPIPLPPLATERMVGDNIRDALQYLKMKCDMVSRYPIVLQGGSSGWATGQAAEAFERRW